MIVKQSSRTRAALEFAEKYVILQKNFDDAEMFEFGAMYLGFLKTREGCHYQNDYVMIWLMGEHFETKITLSIKISVCFYNFQK